MPYPKLFKTVALKTPVLGQIVSERDQLRSNLLSVSSELDLLGKELLATASERDRLSNALLTVSSERDRLSSELLYTSSERDRLSNELLYTSSERDRLHQLLEGIKSGKINHGYCHCCRQETFFQIYGDWLRDQYLCMNCSSIPRQRHIQYVLDVYFKGWESMEIHESSPSNDFIARYCSSYSSSQYFDGIQAGDFIDGVRCENLESLSFKDNSFDLFITQDVLEHVFNPDRAAFEIMRVLKPGGVHVFTVPRNKGLSSSYPRAKLVGSKIQYIKEASYHGSPIGDGKALVTWDYGDDFESLIDGWSGATTTTYLKQDRSLGIDGECLEVFVSRKNGSM